MNLDEMPDLNPWDSDGVAMARGWTDRTLIAHGGVSDSFPSVGNVVEIVARFESADDWDGVAAAVLLLDDGRFMSWETFWGPTGDGFSDDAYGGDAEVHFGDSLETIKRWALTAEARRNLNMTLPEDRHRAQAAQGEAGRGVGRGRWQG